MCTGYAIRERSPWFNFYSCLLINAAVTVTHLFSVDAAAPLDSIFWVRTIQLNAITLAVHALVWHSLRSQWLRALEHRAVAVDSVLTLEIGLAAALNIGLLARWQLTGLRESTRRNSCCGQLLGMVCVCHVVYCPGR